MPARSPVAEWHFEQFPAPLKYARPFSAFPVSRSATSTARRPPPAASAFVFWSWMNATIAPRSASLKSNDGIPLSGRPTRSSGPIVSPRESSATSVERVRSGPVSPPAASRPWQNPHSDRKRVCPAMTSSAGYDCGFTVSGGFRDAGLCCAAARQLPAASRTATIHHVCFIRAILCHRIVAFS